MENLIGRVINERYRVDESLGNSGMADVYKVWDIRRSTYLALKHLRVDFSKAPDFFQQFKREIEQVKKLLHPNIVRFHGLEEAEGQVFILMDFVERITLSKAILSANGIPFTASEIMEIVQPVCSALHYAHQMGIVHGDLKPVNIMIEKSGWVQVANFGITRLTARNKITSPAGSDTSSYATPEQEKGLEPTPQTDIYALGLVLFELLTGGEKPFTSTIIPGSGFAGGKIRQDQFDRKLVSPRAFNLQISAGLERVVMKCLENDPRLRFSSTLELLDALQISPWERNARSATKSKEEPTQPVSEARSEIGTSPMPKGRRKVNWIKYLWGGAILILLLLIGVISYFYFDKSQNSPIEVKQSSVITPELQNTPIPDNPLPIEVITSQATSVSTIPATNAATSITSAIQAKVSKENRNGTGNINNSGLAAIQGDWIYYRNDSDGGKIYRISQDGSKKEQMNSDNSYNITISGDWIFYRNDSDAGKLYRLPVDGGDHQKLNEEFSGYINPAGEWIYYQNHTGGDTIYRLRMDGSGREKLTDGESSFISVYKDWVYFVNDSDGHKIYRMQLDGSGKEKITDDFCSQLNVFDDHLYYITRNLVFDPGNSSWSTESTTINRMQLDGSRKEILITSKNGSINGYINVFGDRIFYIPVISYFNDNNNASINIGGLMYRTLLDEIKRETINDSGCNSINVVGDWIYYRKGGIGGKIFRMHLDGSAKESVS